MKTEYIVRCCNLQAGLKKWYLIEIMEGFTFVDLVERAEFTKATFVNFFSEIAVTGSVVVDAEFDWIEFTFSSSKYQTPDQR